MARQSSFLIILFIIGLIVFDAAQQQFYINTYKLAPKPVLLGHLLKSQSINWAVWGLIGIPFGWFVWNQLRNVRFGVKSFMLIFIAAVFSVAISVISVSLISMWRQDLNVLVAILKEFAIFFAFQKGLTFFMAYGTIAILLNNYYQVIKVNAKEVEIVNLKRNSEKLEQDLRSRIDDEEPFLTIKTGNKVTPIALSDIIWIQSDDYCVRIHTEDRSYSLRKSMKALEEQLRHFRFIRIHRGALLNLHYIDQINFESSTIRLQNDRELPLSRSGLKTLKKRIKESSL